MWAVARFFFGAHDLEIERGRSGGGRHVSRDARVCRCCEARQREDELHFLLECPAYASLRAAHVVAFEGAPAGQPHWQCMRTVTQAGSNKQRWNALADFLIRAVAQRKSMYQAAGLG